MKLTADALNHLLRQNSWAAPLLRPYAGKVVKIALPPLWATLAIDRAGEFESTPVDSVVDAAITVSAGGALRMLFDREATGAATIDGDAELGAAVGKVLRGLRWDAVEDLSRIIGDIPAHELSRAGSHIREEIKRQARSAATMLSEFWLEEQPLLAKKRHLEQFSCDVDHLRDAAERLAKRLERLEKEV